MQHAFSHARPRIVRMAGRPTLVAVGHLRREADGQDREGIKIGGLARLLEVEPVTDLEELVADIWESDDEFDEFLADLRAARNDRLPDVSFRDSVIE